MAFIVVQHLDPTHESLLPEILAQKTTMAVSSATAGEAVRPDHVYVIPPDALLTVHQGLIEVKRRTIIVLAFVERHVAHHALEARDERVFAIGHDRDPVRWDK
jgi:chemotaxis response regulator CheB